MSIKEIKLSVIMSVYNGEKTVREAIDSILNQSFSHFEFIIINDGSTDNTFKIINSYLDKRIKIINQNNQGQPKSLNTAIRASRGEYIAHIDADDISLPIRLERQIEFLDQNPKVGLVGSMAIEVNELIGKERKILVPLTNQSIRRAMAFYAPFIHSSAMMRRSVLREVGLYNEVYTYSEDAELWVRIAKKYEVANLNEILIKKRIHKGQYFRNLDDEIRLRNEAYIGLMATVTFSLPPALFLYALIWFIYSRFSSRGRKFIKFLFFDSLKNWMRKKRGGWEIVS